MGVFGSNPIQITVAYFIVASLLSFLGGCLMQEQNADPILENHEDSSTSILLAPRFQDGCSAPLMAGLFVTVVTGQNLYQLFNDACNFHDDCYHSSLAAYNKNRNYCESEFYTKMMAKCATLVCLKDANGMNLFCPREECYTAAAYVSAGTTTQGNQYYHQPRCTNGEAINTSQENELYTCSTYEVSPLISLSPDIPRLISIINSSNYLYTKSGGVSNPWTLMLGSVKSVKSDGFRIAAINHSNTLYVKEGELSANWKTLHGDVKQLAMNTSNSISRIGVLLNDGKVKVKEGGLSAPWKEIASNVKKVGMFGERIGVLGNDGVLRVLDNLSTINWTTLDGGISDFQLYGTRIGALYANGQLKVKEGWLSSGWSPPLEYGVVAFQLEGTRVGVLLSNGTLKVKEGATSNIWHNLDSPVQSFKLRGARVAAVMSSGELRVKEGNLNNQWSLNVANQVSNVDMEGNRIIIKTTNSAIYIKEGSISATWNLMDANTKEFSISGPSSWPN
jgi:hypothetical protein